MAKNPHYVWDYDIDQTEFEEILSGEKKIGRLDRDWAAVRMLEYASYKEIVRLLGFDGIVAGWPLWREKVRSQSRKRGFDFLVEWLVEKRPELLHVELTNGD